jgi:hypothetical protein
MKIPWERRHLACLLVDSHESSGLLVIAAKMAAFPGGTIFILGGVAPRHEKLP